MNLGGNPSGGSSVSFAVWNLPGIPGNWVAWSVSNLYPPLELDVDEYWEVEIDSTVGASFQIESRSIATLNSSSHDGNLTNTIGFTATVRVSLVDCLTCTIDSEAGAPTTPLPPVPLVPTLSPVALGLLGVAVIILGVIAVTRRSSSSQLR